MHALLLLAALIGPADEVVAKASILDQLGRAPATSAPFGRMLVFDGTKAVRGDKPNSVKWSVEPSQMDARKWQPTPNAFAITPEPLDSAGTPYDLIIIQSVALGDTTDHLVIRVRCGEGGLPPPNPKDEDDKPKPPNLDSPLGLMRVAYEAKQQVSSSTKAADTIAISGAHIDAVKEFAVKWPPDDGEFFPKAKPFTLISQVQESCAKRIGAAMDANARKRWASWSAAINGKLDALQTSGQVKTVDDWLEAYIEIALGVGLK